MALLAQRTAAQPLAPSRRWLAPNVIALWPEDRPPVVNRPRRGPVPQGVASHLDARRQRLRPGCYCILWGRCQPANRGIVVRLLRQDTIHAPYFWWVEAAGVCLTTVNLDTGEVVPRKVRIAQAHPDNLRRCPAPKGARHA